MATSRSKSMKNTSFIYHSEEVEKFEYDFQHQKSTASQLLPQEVESLCRDSALIYLHGIAGAHYITWFCCQTVRWVLRPNLPLASCSPGIGPINPLGLLSTTVSGTKHLGGGYNHSPTTLKYLKHLRSPLCGSHSSLSLLMSATMESSRVKLYSHATFHTYKCFTSSLFAIPWKYNTHTEAHTLKLQVLQSAGRYYFNCLSC